MTFPHSTLYRYWNLVLLLLLQHYSYDRFFIRAKWFSILHCRAICIHIRIGKLKKKNDKILQYFKLRNLFDKFILFNFNVNCHRVKKKEKAYGYKTGYYTICYVVWKLGSVEIKNSVRVPCVSVGFRFSLRGESKCSVLCQGEAI